MKKILLLVSVLLAACSPKAPKEIQYVDLQVDKEIDAFSDSTFFSAIACMTEYDGELYMSDMGRNQIFRLDKDLNLLATIGRQGQGPEEMMSVSGLNISDGTILVNDALKNTLHKYSLSGVYKGYISNFKIAVKLPSRFSFRDDVIRISRPNDTFALAAVDVTDTTKQTRFADMYEFGNQGKDYMRNVRNVFENKKNVIVTSDNVPYIEKYDKKGKLIEKYNISGVELIKKELDYRASQAKINDGGYSFFSYDTYLHKDKLYILFICKIDGYCSNKIIELDVSSDITPTKIYTLPGKIYNSFCVDDDYIYAFNIKEALIQRFKK